MINSRFIRKFVPVFLTAALVAAGCLPALADSSSGQTGVTVSLDRNVLDSSSGTQTVVMTVELTKAEYLGGYQFDSVYPENFTVTSITNDDPGTASSFSDNNINLSNGKVMWFDMSSLKDRELTRLGQVVFSIPAGTPDGVYVLGVEKVKAFKDSGRTTVINESGPVTATLTIGSENAQQPASGSEENKDQNSSQGSSQQKTEDQTESGSGSSQASGKTESSGSSGSANDPLITIDDNPVPSNIQEKDADMNFTDVKNSDWYYEAVKYALNNGLFKGISSESFGPDASMNRAMLVTVLFRMDKAEGSSQKSAFSDVASGLWYSDAVSWASENGIVTGYQDGTFRPEQTVSREQLAAIIYRYSNYRKTSLKAGGADLTAPDAAEVSSWSREAMSWCMENGIITGMNDGRLAPGENTSRAQVAAVIMRYGKLTA